MKNGDSLVGLFQGMFPNNMLSYNPGWDQSAQYLDAFDDVRGIQQELASKGIQTGDKIDPNSEGPASFMVTDLDGNVILIDQHR